jgi:hypothetical protein
LADNEENQPWWQTKMHSSMSKSADFLLSLLAKLCAETLRGRLSPLYIPLFSNFGISNELSIQFFYLVAFRQL